MAEFRFTNEHSPSEVGGVIDVLRAPRLWIPTETDYPAHSEWVEKAEAQIHTGKKRAMLAYHNRKPVGTVIYQRHELFPEIVELRNFSVIPDATGRYIGSFLLRNAEIEAFKNDFPDTLGIMADTKITNIEMIEFLERHGYRLEEIADLYNSGTAEDAVFIKSAAK
jgi:ribosomal protein S18 acetylase RimI-like enzyme